MTSVVRVVRLFPAVGEHCRGHARDPSAAGARDRRIAGARRQPRVRARRRHARRVDRRRRRGREGAGRRVARRILCARASSRRCSPPTQPKSSDRASSTRPHAIAELLERRDRVALAPDEQDEISRTLAQLVLTLWHTRMVRPTRLRVIDEVKNGINYFHSTFFAELPRLVRAIRGPAASTLSRNARGSCRASSASAAGSAAIGTAIRSSPPRSCARRCDCSRLPPCRSISASCTRSGRTCRSRSNGSRSRRHCRRSRTGRRTPRRSAPTSPIDAH